MPNSVIVLTGVHQIVTPLLREYYSSEMAFFPSLMDSFQRRTPSHHWETCPFFHELVMLREMRRDQEIQNVFHGSVRTAVVEQWHVGNVAWSRAHSSNVSEEYDAYLPTLLQSISAASIAVWFISTDLEKLFPESRQLRYQSYLRELAETVGSHQIKLEMIDGEAPPKFVKQRINYLVDQFSGGAAKKGQPYST